METNNANMPVNSLIDNIVPSECNQHVVVYSNHHWANGKMGSITDSKGDGIYRFYEMKEGKFSADVISEKPEDNPIVATGIVAYCFHNRRYKNILFERLRLPSFSPKSINDQFIGYTAIVYNEYKERRDQEPDSWRCDIEKEFYTKYIIPYVKQQNKISEALFEFLTPKDCRFLEDLMQEYNLYLEYKKREYELPYEDSLDHVVDKRVNVLVEKDLAEHTITNEEIDAICADETVQVQPHTTEKGIKPKATSYTNIESKEERIIDEEWLKSHFKIQFKREDGGFDTLVNMLKANHSPKYFAKIALQIYESRYFIKTDFATFSSWYKSFCEKIGCHYCSNYKPSKLKLTKEESSSFYFLKQV